jgi:hypothetical protein
MCVAELSLEARARIEEKRDRTRFFKAFIPARDLLGSSPPKPATFELALRRYVSARFGVEAQEYTAICTDSDCLNTALDDLTLRIEAEVLREFNGPRYRHVSVERTGFIVKDELEGCVNRCQHTPFPAVQPGKPEEVPSPEGGYPFQKTTESAVPDQDLSADAKAAILNKLDAVSAIVESALQGVICGTTSLVV